MTNTPQIPTIPQDVMDAIEEYGLVCYTSARWQPEKRAKAKQALLAAIAAHLRPVVPDVGDTDVVEMVVEAIMPELMETIAYFARCQVNELKEGRPRARAFAECIADHHGKYWAEKIRGHYRYEHVNGD